MIQEFNGRVEGGVAGRDLTNNHFHAMPCPGPAACPHRIGPVGSPDAKDENEFFNDTGIRTSPTGRRLLNELQARHGLRWRGSGSLLRCWRRQTITYVDGDRELRITPDWFNWTYGWLLFCLGVSCEIAVAVNAIAKTASAWSVVLFVSGLIFMWFAAEHLIAPTNIARRLLKKEKATCEAAQGV